MTLCLHLVHKIPFAFYVADSHPLYLFYPWRWHCLILTRTGQKVDLIFHTKSDRLFLVLWCIEPRRWWGHIQTQYDAVLPCDRDRDACPGSVVGTQLQLTLLDCIKCGRKGVGDHPWIHELWDRWHLTGAPWVQRVPIRNISFISPFWIL